MHTSPLPHLPAMWRRLAWGGGGGRPSLTGRIPPPGLPTTIGIGPSYPWPEIPFVLKPPPIPVQENDSEFIDQKQPSPHIPPHPTRGPTKQVQEFQLNQSKSLDYYSPPIPIAGCCCCPPCCPFSCCWSFTGDSVFSCDAVTDRVCRVDALATDG